MEKDKTVEFDDFRNLNDTNRPDGDLKSAEVQQRLAAERKALMSELESLSTNLVNLSNRLNAAEPADKSRLMAEYRKLSENKNSVKHKLETLDKQLAAFSAKPNEFTNLYNAGENVGKNDGVNKTELKTDENGNLKLVVEMMRPSPFGFTISDGHLTFENSDVSSEQLKEMLEVLDKMGIKNIRIPDELDKKLKDGLNKAINERREAENNNYDRNRAPVMIDGMRVPDTFPANQPEEARDNASPSPEAELPVIPGANPEFDNAEPANLPQAPEAPQYPYDYKELHHKIEFDILQRNMGKVKDSSFFHVKEGGYDKWYVYDTQNPNNYDNDGKRDKDGDVKVKNAFVIWAKEKDDGSIELGYSMPNGKPVSNALADKLISLHKDRGATHIKFGGMTDDDAGTFRTRCARLGIIPIGIGINEKQAAEMVGEAAKKLSDKDLQTFKWRLAQQMRQNIRNSGKSVEDDRSVAYIKELEGDFKFNPFKNAYDDVFKGIIEHEKRSMKAENAIGAVNALDKIFEAYRGGMETDDPGAVTMSDILKPQNNLFTEEEINAIKAKYAENGMSIPLDKPMNELKKEDLGMMFEAVLPIQRKQAYEELKTESGRYESAKEKDDAVKEMIDGANLKMDRISGELEQKGIKKMYFARINRSMKFSGRDNTQNNTQNNRSATQTPPARYHSGNTGR